MSRIFRGVAIMWAVVLFAYMFELLIHLATTHPLIGTPLIITALGVLAGTTGGH